MASRGKKKPSDKSESELARKFKSKPFVVIGTFFILVIVVVAFVFVTPAGAIFGGMMGGDLTFGFYDRVPINYAPGNVFHDHHEWLSRQWQFFMGGELSVAIQDRIWRESFEAAAVNTAIIRTMERAGYEPPSRVVDREMMNLPIFQDNGNFSLALYRQVDESRRLAIRRRVQDDISVARFRADVDGLLTPSTESGFMGRMASTERSFEMVVFSVDAFPESEIEAYVLENPDLFRSAHLSMVTIRGNEREARRILASVDNGELTFEDAARIYSNNIFSDRGGDMGPMMAHELRFHIPDQDVLEAALSVPAGGHSDVLRTAAGWVFFRAESDVQDADLSDPLVMGRVGAYMRSFARGRMENWAIAQAEEFGILANEYGLDGALAQHPELERREFGPVPINFGSVDLFSTLGHDVNELAGSAMNEHFWTVAFSTPLNNASGPVVQGGNVLVLFPTTETEGHYTANAMVASNYTDFWLLNTNDQLLHQHIMNSPRFDDRFIEMHSRLFFRH